MQLSDFRLKVFLFFILVYLYLQIFNQFDQANTNTNTKTSQFDHQANTVLPASKSSVKSFTAKFHFFSAFSSGPSGKVTILVLAHNSIKVKKSNFHPQRKRDGMLWKDLKVLKVDLYLSERRLVLQSYSGAWTKTTEGAGEALKYTFLRHSGIFIDAIVLL